MPASQSVGTRPACSPAARACNWGTPSSRCTTGSMPCCGGPGLRTAMCLVLGDGEALVRPVPPSLRQSRRASWDLMAPALRPRPSIPPTPHPPSHPTPSPVPIHPLRPAGCPGSGPRCGRGPLCRRSRVHGAGSAAAAPRGRQARAPLFRSLAQWPRHCQGQGHAEAACPPWHGAASRRPQLAASKSLPGRPPSRCPCSAGFRGSGAAHRPGQRLAAYHAGRAAAIPADAGCPRQRPAGPAVREGSGAMHAFTCNRHRPGSLGEQPGDAGAAMVLGG